MREPARECNADHVPNNGQPRAVVLGAKLDPQIFPLIDLGDEPWYRGVGFDVLKARFTEIRPPISMVQVKFDFVV
jgi:hypothetical protein